LTCMGMETALEAYLTKTTTKEDLLHALKEVSKKVCSQISPLLISEKECTSFVSLYGPYTIDMIFAGTKGDLVCSRLKLCTQSSDEYTLLYPIIDEEDQMVTYTTTEKNVTNVGQQFRYRIFLGNPSFLDEETLTVQISENDIAAFSMKLTNKSDYTILNECEANSHAPCTSLTANPGRGVWYYIAVNVQSFLTPNTTSFTITATIQNEIFTGSGFVVKSHRIIIFPVFFPAILIALCLFCCCLRKRVCKKKAVDAQDKATEVAVDMQEMPQPSAPLGYYYPPMNGQYMQVPMQQYAQPFYFPVEKPE